MRIAWLLSATSLVTTLGFLVPSSTLAQGAPHFAGAYVGGSLDANVTTDIFHAFDFSEGAGSTPDWSTATGLTPSITLDGGYNWQNGRFVYGIQADGTLLYANPNVVGKSYSANTQLYGLLALRGRLGFTAGDTLLYGTAGLAAGYGTFAFKSQGEPSPADSVILARGAGVVVGPQVGIGFEKPINDHLSLTAEGVVTELGTLGGSGDNGKGPYNVADTKLNLAVRGGLAYHF